MRPLLALLMCIGLAACGGQGSLLGMRGCGLGPAIELPIDLTRKATIVTVTINQRRARLLLDTGANVTVLNRGSASVLGVTAVADSKSVFQAVGGVTGAERGVVDTMLIGGVPINNLRVAVNPETIEDGVLGLDVLQRFDVDIDIPKGRVALHQGGLCPADKPPFESAMLEIPAKRAIVRGSGATQVIDPYLMVPISLDGAVTLGMFDTGALAGSLISTPFAAKAGVTEAQMQSDPGVTARGFGTSIPLHRHRFGQLFVGREVFDKPVILVGGDARQIFPVILGIDYFQTHRVWFNFASDRVFVVPVHAQPMLSGEGG